MSPTRKPDRSWAASGKRPRVSVVVLTRNREKLLGDCLGTLLAQDYPGSRTEIIVVDDGSTDGTAQTVQALAREHSRLRYIPQAHRGIPAARNAGIRASRGELVAIVADDYLLSPDYLRTAVLFFEKNPKAQILRFKVVPRSSGLSDLINRFAYEVEFLQRLHPDEAWAPRPLDWRFYAHVPRLSDDGPTAAPFLEAAGGAVFRRGLFARVGFFDENLLRSEDTDFSVRLRRHGITAYYDSSQGIRHATGFWARETIPKRFLAGYYLQKNRRKNRLASFSGRPESPRGVRTVEGLLSIFRMARAAYPGLQALSLMPFMTVFLAAQKLGSALARLEGHLSTATGRDA